MQGEAELCIESSNGGVRNGIQTVPQRNEHIPLFLET